MQAAGSSKLSFVASRHSGATSSFPPLAAGFSLVIPAWNEEARLERTLEQYLPAFEASGNDYEVIVVTDGCTDHTRHVAERNSHRGVRVVEFPHRIGKGAAIFEGLDRARFDRVGFADADASVSAHDVLRVEAALDRSDCAIASRRAQGASFRVPRPFVRSLLSRGWNLLVRGVLFLPFLDTQCGVKFLRRPEYLRIRSRAIQFRDWAFDVGMLFLVHGAGKTVAEVPVSWSEEEGSKFRIVRDAPKMFRSLMGVRLMRLDRPDSRPTAPDLPPEPAPSAAPPRPLPRFFNSPPALSLSGRLPPSAVADSSPSDRRWSHRPGD
jgi:dolichol-phosphate mannosyltransferase